VKALVKKDNTENLVIDDIPEVPVEPGLVKIEVKYAGICGTDLHILKNEYKHDVPIVPGHEFSGVIVEVGEADGPFKIGDRVVSLTTAQTCGICDYCISGIRMLCKKRRSIGTHVQGVFTKYLTIDQKLVLKIPGHISLEEAALTEPLACAVHGVMEMSRVSAGDVVYISGPGTIGLMAMQVSRAEGGLVVVAGTSADQDRLKLAADLGAEYTIELGVAEPRQVVDDLTDGYGADVAVECAGAEASAKSCLEVLRGRGRYHQLGLYGREINVNLDHFVFKEIYISTSYATTFSSFKRALRLMDLGKVDMKPLVSAVYPLEDWEKAFTMFENKEGFKILLCP
jgi:L-iditol 2-dehydrogenase